MRPKRLVAGTPTICGDGSMPGCEDFPATTDFGRSRVGHIEMDVTFDGETPTAIAIQAAVDTSRNTRLVGPHETLAVQLVHWSRLR